MHAKTLHQSSRKQIEEREQGSTKGMGVGLCRQKMVGIKREVKGGKGKDVLVQQEQGKRGATVTHMGDGKPREIQ